MEQHGNGKTSKPDAGPGLGIMSPAPPLESRKHRLTWQVFRFGVVGVLNTVVDLAVLNLLIFTTGTGTTGLMYAVYKTVAFVCAVLNSYLMNRAWTFQSVPSKSQMLEGSQFMFISVLGWVVNVGSSWYVATYVHPFAGLSPKAWPSIAALVGTAFSLGFNFIGYKFWVFAHRRHR
ncbi:MAG: GtrA family protein [Acidobacteria bacterium]|nr:GtrA family protein [Acidobacteriota bacterium]MBV9147775.1 GtrA family protein [Acidobacteriota bacterium]MBV9437928.1 GtrA family protein [Acidobacteriota bacterium]